MIVFADSSFLVSLYIADSNSVAAVSAMTQLKLPILTTPLGELEMENAIQLRVFRGQIKATDKRPGAAMRDDIARGVLAIKPVTDAMFIEARKLAALWTASLGTRTIDLFHVASAIVLKADTFVTFDDRQKRLAKAAGLVCG